jgi:hypothetical protein
MRNIFIVVLALSVAGCGTDASGSKQPQAMPVPKDRPATAVPAPALKIDKRGLGDVIGKGMADLKRMFGEPRIDVVEVHGRKLQFSGKACILDAYLYPDGKGGAEVVTHVDARRSDGAEVDRAACVDALMRR